MDKLSVVNLIKIKIWIFKNKCNKLLSEYPGIFSIAIGVMIIYFYYLYEKIYKGLKGLNFITTIENILIFQRQMFIVYNVIFLIGLMVVSCIAYDITIKFLKENMHIPLDGTKVFISNVLSYSIGYLLVVVPIIATVCMAFQMKIYIIIVSIAFFIIIQLVTLVFIALVSYIVSLLLKSKIKFIRNIYVYIISSILTTSMLFIINKIFVINKDSIIYFYFIVVAEICAMLIILKFTSKSLRVSLIEEGKTYRLVGSRIFLKNMPMPVKIQLVSMLRNYRVYYIYVASSLIILSMFKIMNLGINKTLFIQFASILQIVTLSVKYNFQFQLTKIPINNVVYNITDYVFSMILVYLFYFILIFGFGGQVIIKYLSMLFQVSTLIFVLQLIIKYPLNLERSNSMIHILFYQLIISIIIIALQLIYNYVNYNIISLIVVGILMINILIELYTIDLKG